MIFDILGLLASHLLPYACNGICGFITAPYIIWFPIVLAAVLMIILLLAIIYMLSPMIGRNDVRAWVRVKIYDELQSIILIIIFSGVATVFFLVPPAGILYNVGLLPQGCYNIIQTAAASATGNPISATFAQYDSLYFVAVCDMWSYNSDVNVFTEGTFWISLMTALSPSVDFMYPGGPITNGIGGQFQQYNFSNVGVSATFTFLPIEPVFFYIVPLLNTLYLFYILSQVQQLLIGAAPLIFAIFMAIGLIARAFGVTRTFGGAMIAFAIGIGIIYPLMTALSYGFLDTALANAGPLFECTLGFTTPGIGCGNITLGDGNVIFQIVDSVINIISDAGPLVFLYSVIQAALVYSGLIAIGLTFIPLLNLTVVDVFIVDFSRAVGERMDFLSLLTRIV